MLALHGKRERIEQEIDTLEFGDLFVLCLEDEEESERKLTVKYSISEKVTASKFDVGMRSALIL